MNKPEDLENMINAEVDKALLSVKDIPEFSSIPNEALKVFITNCMLKGANVVLDIAVKNQKNFI